MSEIAFIALGSNMGDRLKNLQEAVKRLRKKEGIKSVTCSPVWETKPWGVKNQEPFHNAAAQVKTSLPPEALLKTLLTVENEMGRVRKAQWGPRVIDLDLILMGDQRVETEALSLPHPHFAERLFVLIPLLSLNANLTHPVSGERLADLAKSIADDQWGTVVGPLEG